MLTMEEVLKQSNVRFAEEEIVKGKVIEIRQKEVLVDIGYKSEGSISTNEFDEDDPPKVGDEVEVLIERLENREGMVELSHERAEFKKNWDKINSICQEGGRIKGKIKQAVRGGLIVNIGVEAFLPSSQVDVVPTRDFDALVGQTFEFKIVKINQGPLPALDTEMRERMRTEVEIKKRSGRYAEWIKMLKRTAIIRRNA